MKSWSQCCTEVGFDPRDWNPPEINYIYYAYKNGKAEQFSTLALAKAYSTNTEKVAEQFSKQQYDHYCKGHRELESKAADVWHNALKKEYAELTVKVYNKCYSEAYSRGHSAGYDEVASAMDSIVDFVEEILALAK